MQTRESSRKVMSPTQAQYNVVDNDREFRRSVCRIETHYQPNGFYLQDRVQLRFLVVQLVLNFKRYTILNVWVT